MEIPANKNGKTVYQKVLEKVNECNFLQYLQISIDTVEDGVVEASITLLPSYLQQQKVAHGGLITTLADSVAGFAAVSKTPENRHVVTVELKISFLRPAKGDRLTAKGQVIKAGRQFHFCEAEVWCDNLIVAKASATMAIILP